jgi:hypothetical protein
MGVPLLDFTLKMCVWRWGVSVTEVVYYLLDNQDSVPSSAEIVTMSRQALGPHLSSCPVISRGSLPECKTDYASPDLRNTFKKCGACVQVQLCI